MARSRGIVAIGASLGGSAALRALLGLLPAGLALPVAVALHRGERGPEKALVALLQGASRLPVREPLDKDPLQAGQVALAPAGYHLLVEPGCYALSTEGPVCCARPSVNVLLASAADAFGPAALGVILTGRGQDGAAGLAALVAAGGQALVLAPAEAEAPEMPVAALAAVPAARAMTLAEFARAIVVFAGSPGAEEGGAGEGRRKT